MARCRPSRVRTVLAVPAVLVLGLTFGACGSEDGDAEAAGATPSTTTTSTTGARSPADGTSSASAPADPPPAGAVDLVDPPQGAPPRGDLVIDQTVQLGGRTIETDLPAQAQVGIMGTVGDLVVLTGSLPRDAGVRYWSVDDGGTATAIGTGAYESYNVAPVLVEETGHIWVDYADRGTGSSEITVLDVPSGKELFRLEDREQPPALSGADQDVYDLFTDGGEPPAEPPPTSPDGSLQAAVVEKQEGGTSRYVLVVRPADGGKPVRRIVFPLGSELPDRDARLQTCPIDPADCTVDVSIGGVQFEDDEHVLVGAYVSTSDSSYAEEPVTDTWILRCDLQGTCERALESGHTFSLGVHSYA